MTPNMILAQGIMKETEITPVGWIIQGIARNTKRNWALLKTRFMRKKELMIYWIVKEGLAIITMILTP